MNAQLVRIPQHSRRNDNAISHFRCVHDSDLLDRVLVPDPRIQAALQRTHTRDAALAQLQRHPGAGRFVRSSAIQDDVAVAGYLVMAHLQLLRREAQRSGDLHRIFVEREFVAQVDHNHRNPAVDLCF